MSDRVATFRAMGTEVVVAGAGPTALRSIRDLFEQREQAFSRFRPGSELSRVNAATSHVIRVSPLFAATLRRALVAARLTGGLVDPTLGAALAAAGYDRDFASLAETAWPVAAGAPGAATGGTPAPRSRLHQLRLSGRFLSRPAGLVLDLNGVVKALAVDDPLALLDRPGHVAAGGDLAVRGPAVIALPPGGGASPGSAPPAVRLERGGLATSGTSRRRWLHDGVPQHHLIDPATGRPSAAPWECVTVAAGSCHHADVAAKAAFLAGAAGPAWLDERGLAGRFLRPDGSVTANEEWRRFVGADADPAAGPDPALPAQPSPVTAKEPSCS